MQIATVIDTITIGDRTWRFQDYAALDRAGREKFAADVGTAETGYQFAFLKEHKHLPRNCNQADAILRSWEERVATPMENLERLLKNHDWYYEMSDDFRWYSAGETQRRRILALVEQLGDEGRRLYESYSLKHMGHT